MYVDEILARLKNGESADDIAKSYTDALNKAIAAKREEDNKRIEEEVFAGKVADMMDILQLIADFVTRYYPELAKDADLNFSEDETKALLNELDKTIKFFKTPSTKAEDAITTFLKLNGLL